MLSVNYVADFKAYLKAYVRPFHIALLFTYSDLKTILFPIVIFAQLSCYPTIFHHLGHTTLWVWMHLLQFCVSNQTTGLDEDIKNKPWRPIAARSISMASALVLRWALVPICVTLSSFYGVHYISVIFSVGVYFHNELHFDSHWLWRNIFNALGYATFDWGASYIARGGVVPYQALLARYTSILIVLTTIHAQDFRDEEGDRLLKRRTLPIVMPVFARVSMLVTLVFWSLTLSVLWNPNAGVSITLLGLGVFIGMRFIHRCSKRDDDISYILYNLWLSLARAIPLLVVGGQVVGITAP